MLPTCKGGQRRGKGILSRLLVKKLTMSQVTVGTVVRARNGQFAESKWIRGLKKTIVYSAIATTVVWSYIGIWQLSAVTHAGELSYIAVPLKVSQIAPILKKIAAAESGNRQFDANGLPLMHANTNGSVDIGLYQINNRVWGAKAKELGFDLLTEKGQTAMATWLLENKGTAPWGSSAAAWNK